MDAAQLAAWLQEELDACRGARRAQEAAATEAQQRGAVLEVGGASRLGVVVGMLRLRCVFCD